MKMFLGVFYLLFAIMPVYGSSNKLDNNLQKPQKSPAERLAEFQVKQAERRIW